ncbi:hypothetical protein B5M42_020515 [Paenibacillus athensensis]|uniref:Uncharacterized protein n=1 Tax=Paenibacillus athensensis TaxID=1967502 RepID=A0A4Y8PT16_9BACL|nr:hypothetical protein [Paenibacillus athensensis]MCD1261186.1 hypothetical protein [Paenibacillus athensensis]
MDFGGKIIGQTSFSVDEIGLKAAMEDVPTIRFIVDDIDFTRITKDTLPTSKDITNFELKLIKQNLAFALKTVFYKEGTVRPLKEVLDQIKLE